MRYVLRYVVILLLTLFWGVPACVVGLVDRSGEGVIWIGRRWIGWIFRACGIRVVHEGLERIDPKQPYVIMSNHQSAVDIGAIVVTLPVSFRFVAKRELTWIPLFGWALVLGGHVIIDRARRERAVQSLSRAATRIRNGVNVIIFPEGTRSPTGALRELKSGGFHLAMEAGVPILPVTVSGSHHVAPKRSLRVESGVVKVRIGDPISTALPPGDASRQRLKAEVREAIEKGFDPVLQAPAPPT